MYKGFAYSSEFVIGLIFLVIGLLIMYYGQQVSYVFEMKSMDNYEENKEMSFKVNFII